jgi:cell fate regulator YaaT (PSP1 superfamily)
MRDIGPIAVYNAADLEVKEGVVVIFEHDRGLDYGKVISLKGGACCGGKSKQPVKNILRIARDGDIKQIEDNRTKAKEAFNICSKKMEDHKPKMKLVQAEYTFDRSKIVFRYTADGRVDFRDLLNDLPKIFKARVELKQIGPRDETKFFGGYGPCGRELCCSKFLSDFESVTIKMAKEQGLPLNPPKISGICGRLMCCLNYENDTYTLWHKDLPRQGEHISTASGKGRVVSVNVFKHSVVIEQEDGKFTEVVYNKDNKDKDEKESKERDDRENKPGRDIRDNRDARENRQGRDIRDNRVARENNPVRDIRDNRGNKPGRDNRDNRERHGR